MRLSAYDDDRARRRDRACVAAGMSSGAALGLFAGTLVEPSVVLLFMVMGVVAGGVAGRLIAPHISSDEWDPSLASARRPNVGAASPDDDITA